MTISEMAKFVGRTARFTVPYATGMKFDVVVLDIKSGGWGRTIATVKPLSGSGTLNLMLEKLEFQPEADEEAPEEVNPKPVTEADIKAAELAELEDNVRAAELKAGWDPTP